MFKLSLLAVTISFFASSVFAQDISEKLRKCYEGLDYSCIYNELIVRFETTDEGPLGGDGRWVTIAGAKMINSLEKIVKEMDPSTGRLEVERTIAVVEQKHGDTPFLRGALYLFLTEQCDLGGDQECVEVATGFICNNINKLAAPQSFGKSNEDVMNRMMNVLIKCEGL